MYAFFAEFCQLNSIFMAQVRKPDIEEGWYHVLKMQFEADYFAELKEILLAEKEKICRLSAITIDI